MAGHPGKPRPLHELGELARAAGEPDLDPAARSRGSPDHPDRRPAAVDFLGDGLRHPRIDPPRRRARVVAEAIDAWPALPDPADRHRTSAGLVRVSRLPE